MPLDKITPSDKSGNRNVQGGQKGHLGNHTVKIEYKQLFRDGVELNLGKKENFSIGKTAPNGMEAKKTDDWGRTFFFTKK